MFLPAAGNLPHWRAICAQWLAEFERFCQVTEYQDAPHEHLERANAGILAIAAAKCGHGVLPEPYINRGGAGGYLDLCILNIHTGVMELVECKWVDSVGRAIVSAAQAEMALACTQVASVVGPPTPPMGKFLSLTKIGVVFACPRFPPDTNSDQVTADVQTIVSTFQASQFFDAMAWFFPDVPAIKQLLES